MKLFYSLFLSVGIIASSAVAQKINPYLAQSNWPIFHANNNATASLQVKQSLHFPLSLQMIDAASQFGLKKGKVSPWTVARAPYPNGAQTLFTTPDNGVAKYVIDGDRFEAIDFLHLARGILNFDWNIVVLRNNDMVVTNRSENEYIIIGDKTNDAESELIIKHKISIDESRYGKISYLFSLAYDGTLITLTKNGQILAIDIDAGQIKSAYTLPQDKGADFHNSFVIDETNRLYLAGQRAVLALDWNGTSFSQAWMAPYDMRGPGCDPDEEISRFREVLRVARGEICTGSGTTPTLLGSRHDGVLVIVDGHQPKNNIVAFWRHTPPADWGGIAGQSRQVAGIMPLPYSTPLGDGFTAENSPAVLGNAIVIAQWGGFDPEKDTPRGVQRVDWQPRSKRFRLRWANPNVHYNGVPTIGRYRNGAYVFGMGRGGDGYEYNVLDFRSGASVQQIPIADNDDFLDQGNNHMIADDGSVIYSGQRSMVRVHGAKPINR